jgi:DNA-binding LacI/PurR family transcriptional regulator
MMDAHAWAIQDLMARTAPDLLERVGIIGSGDTPWSRFGRPPFSSVGWNLESIAHETALLVEGARARRGAPIEVYVKPNLIVRRER